MGNVELSVIIPAYNEEANLEGTVRDVSRYLSDIGLSHEIIVVDDGSKDRTLSVAESLRCEIQSLRTIHYAPNRGKGCAVRTGMLSAEGTRALFTDADNSTPITELPAFMSALDKGGDVAIASRSIRGAVRVIHQPFYRELGGKILNLGIRLFAVPGIADTQCGFKLFTSRAARDIFSRCFIDGFSFDVEALYLARRLGYEIVELPVHWTHHGGSRVSPIRDGLRMLLDIAKIRFHRYGGPGAK
ncbi:MAG: glycosyltransferase family 2 protein [Armatimonadetes bacterium]|nr:glycosyltransferase family 2 protein [Armatimonadota bacterium]